MFVTFNVGDFVQLHGKYIEAGKMHFGIVVRSSFLLAGCFGLYVVLSNAFSREIRGGLHFL